MKEQDTAITIKISSDLLNELKIMSEKTGLKMSNFIRYSIQNMINDLKNGKTVEVQETLQISMKSKK